MPANISALEALDRLRAGNARFASNVISIDSLARQLDRGALKRAQAPIAIVLGCSDSRAPAELVFDQGLGELFVIRVAGNVVSPSQVGSVEFAAERYGVRLVVVMGHTLCGAVDATIDAVEQPQGTASEGLMSIVERVRPAVEAARLAGTTDRAAVARAAIRINVKMAVEHLRHGSPLLERLLTREGLMVIGAEYDLETGKVEFFG
jgi:carbonic anhydrase